MGHKLEVDRKPVLWLGYLGVRVQNRDASVKSTQLADFF